MRGSGECLRPGPNSTIVAAPCEGGAADAGWVEDVAPRSGWLAWAQPGFGAGDGPKIRYIKIDEHAAPNVTSRADFCIRGRMYLNPSMGQGLQQQSFLFENTTGTLGSTMCVGSRFHCLVVGSDGAEAHGGPCIGSQATGWKRVFTTRGGSH